MKRVTRLLILVFLVLTIVHGMSAYNNRSFAPNLDAAYSDNIWPRVGAALVYGAGRAGSIMFMIAESVVQRIAMIAHDFNSQRQNYAPPPPLPSPPVATPIPVPPPAPPVYVPSAPVTAVAPPSTTQTKSFLAAVFNGICFALIVRTPLFIIAWYLFIIRAVPTTFGVPVVRYTSSNTKGSLLFLQTFIAIFGLIFIFSGQASAGYAGYVVGIIVGSALPIVPHIFFVIAQLLHVDPERVRSRLLPAKKEEGEVIQLRIRRDGVIVKALFKQAYRGIAANAPLTMIALLDLANIAIALRALDGRPLDADLVERYLSQRAPDWREQLEAAEEQEAAEEEPARPVEPEDPYDILGVLPSTPFAEIAAAFRTLMQAAQNLPNPSPQQRRLIAAFQTIKQQRAT